jgi:carbamoyl-phosphate synthase large subunit
VVISKFLENARELEMDAVAWHGQLVVSAVSEHVENAGVHSGDATLVLPPQRTYLETVRRIRKISRASPRRCVMARSTSSSSPGQRRQRDRYSLRLAQLPFVSRCCGLTSSVATAVMGRPVPVQNGSAMDLDYVGVKAPQFSFTRLEGADPVLGVEMASTGEVGCLGDDFEEAFLKALLSVGFKLPIRNVLLSTGPIEGKAAFLEALAPCRHGREPLCHQGTAAFLRANGVGDRAALPRRPAAEHAAVPERAQDRPRHQHRRAAAELANDYLIRRKAADFGIRSSPTSARPAPVEALSKKDLSELHIKSWQEYAFTKRSTGMATPAREADRAPL